MSGFFWQSAIARHTQFGACTSCGKMAPECGGSGTLVKEGEAYLNTHETRHKVSVTNLGLGIPALARSMSDTTTSVHLL